MFLGISFEVAVKPHCIEKHKENVLNITWFLWFDG